MAFDNVLTLLRQTVEKFYPADLVGIPFTAPLNTRSGLPATHLLRMKWIKDHPGVVFDKTNPTHRYQLKDLYIVYGADWTKDPLFRV
jgi:hypothetical protein